MANPAKLEINSWIETVRKQLEQAAQTAGAGSSRNKRNRGSAPPDPNEAQAALIALEDLHNLLATRAEEIDLHELEFIERSERLEAATSQLEDQIKQLAAARQKSEERSNDAHHSSEPPPCWNASDDSQAAYPRAEQQASQQSLPIEVVDSIAERIAGQLALMLDTKFEHLLRQATCNETPNSDQVALPQSSASTASLELADKLAELQHELAIAQAALYDNELIWHHAEDEANAKLAELRDELAAVYESNVALQAELMAAKETVWSLDPHSSIAETTSDDPASSALIADLHAEIESLRETLAAVRSNTWAVDSRTEGGSEDTEQADATARLNAQLADLQEQNADLATQLARLQMAGVHNAPHLNLGKLNQESLTWEQRKRLILQQLENETAASNPEEYQNHRNEVEEIIRTTQAEIERRDAEIAELQSIVQQQSNTREGVAIGAAAIAQMLDSDELVRLEREKLAAIQREWESKLREAEIQMSLERAKLSRERAEFEERLRNPIEPLNPATTEPATNPDGKPVRRWLEHLGLRDK